MSGRDVGNIVEIMKNDFKSAFSNPIVTIVLIAIIILPSLYALLNIQACWDPYGNTGDIQFAIANLDEGASFDGVEINVGNELVSDLKNNDKFNWTFVTEDELRQGVYEGKYYAGIIIPKNLSSNIVSIMGDDPQQAKLEYVVNVKSNPVATKLTDSGANAVYMNLNARIVQIINLAAYGKLGDLQAGLSSGANQLASGGSQLAAGSSLISSGAGQVQNGVGQVQSGSNAVSQGADQIRQGSSAVSQGADQVQQGSEELQSTVDPSLLPDGPVRDFVDGNMRLANASSQLASGSSQLAGGSSQLADGANDLAAGSVELAEGSLSLAAGAQLLSSSASQALFTAASALSASANSLSDITGINETMLGEYFYAPIKLERNEVFSVPDYGSNVAPFYIVLSMWVGALITCVMIEPKSSVGTKYSPFEMYAGKLLIYIIMSIFQACVTIIGACILGVYIDNYPLFIFSAILVSMIFMILIYSIISALRTVGKGICVVLLVLQISATGGIYPIQIMHPFFQTLYPYMPMTYAISLMREAQLGVVWSNYIPALIIILAIGIVTVIVAIFIKERADKRSKYFEEKLEESGLF